MKLVVQHRSRAKDLISLGLKYTITYLLYLMIKVILTVQWH